MHELSTPEKQAAFRQDMQAATEKLLAELRAEKEANSGISASQAAIRRPWQSVNSNFGMGL